MSTYLPVCGDATTVAAGPAAKRQKITLTNEDKKKCCDFWIDTEKRLPGRENRDKREAAKIEFIQDLVQCSGGRYNGLVYRPSFHDTVNRWLKNYDIISDEISKGNSQRFRVSKYSGVIDSPPAFQSAEQREQFDGWVKELTTKLEKMMKLVQEEQKNEEVKNATSLSKIERNGAFVFDAAFNERGNEQLKHLLTDSTLDAVKGYIEFRLNEFKELSNLNLEVDGISLIANMSNYYIDGKALAATGHQKYSVVHSNIPNILETQSKTIDPKSSNIVEGYLALTPGGNGIISHLAEGIPFNPSVFDVVKHLAKEVPRQPHEYYVAEELSKIEGVKKLIQEWGRLAFVSKMVPMEAHHTPPGHMVVLHGNHPHRRFGNAGLQLTLHFTASGSGMNTSLYNTGGMTKELMLHEMIGIVKKSVVPKDRQTTLLLLLSNWFVETIVRSIRAGVEDANVCTPRVNDFTFESKDIQSKFEIFFMMARKEAQMIAFRGSTDSFVSYKNTNDLVQALAHTGPCQSNCGDNVPNGPGGQ